MPEKKSSARNYILRQLEDGTLKAGEKLSGAREIARLTGRPLPAVQSEIELLAQEGVLETVPRRGTFVSLKWDSRILRRNLSLYRPDLTWFDDFRKQLEEVRRVKLRETIAAERLRDLRRELEQARSERETGEQALVAFYRKLGVAGHAEFLELLKRERLRVELSARVAARRADFEASGDSASEECPAEPDPAVLEREREELSRAVAGCDARIGAAESDAERLRQLSDGSGAALRVESLRGEIKAAAREYLIWSEARALLDRAIARYEKERQPELIRRAAGLFRQFAADLVIIPERRAVQANETVVKVSSGAAQYVPIAVVTNISREMKTLQENGFWVYGADMSGDESYSLQFPERTAIVMGSEGSGISQLVRKNCDHIVSIPMNGHIDSLNVSVAAGILMYEFRRNHSVTK